MLYLRKIWWGSLDLPARGIKHSVSTACPASSTNMWVKWPSLRPPVTSLQWNYWDELNGWLVVECQFFFLNCHFILVMLYWKKLRKLECNHAGESIALWACHLPSSCYQGSDHNFIFHQLFFCRKYVTIPQQVRAFLWKCHNVECPCPCVCVCV